jgi:hypothetical protein
VSTKLQGGAKDALNWGERPETPGDVKKYRQSTLNAVGKTLRHPGSADDPIPEGPFGDKSASAAGQNVLEIIKTYPESEIARWKIEQSEAVYAR